MFSTSILEKQTAQVSHITERLERQADVQASPFPSPFPSPLRDGDITGSATLGEDGVRTCRPGLYTSDKENRMSLEGPVVKKWSLTGEAEQLKRQLANEDLARAHADIAASETRRVSARRSAAEGRERTQVNEGQVQKLQLENAHLRRKCEELELRERERELQQRGTDECVVCAARQDRSKQIDIELAEFRRTQQETQKRLQQHLEQAATDARLREEVDEETHLFVEAAKEVKRRLTASETAKVACNLVHAAVVKNLLQMHEVQVLNLSAQIIAAEMGGHAVSQGDCSSLVDLEPHQDCEEIDAEASPVSTMGGQEMTSETALLRERIEVLEAENAQLQEACSVTLPSGYSDHHKRIWYVQQLKQENKHLRMALSDEKAMRWEKAIKAPQLQKQASQPELRRRATGVDAAATAESTACSQVLHEGSQLHAATLTTRPQIASAASASAAARTPRRRSPVLAPRRLEELFVKKTETETRATEAARRTRSMR